jgi:hypothetical protein
MGERLISRNSQPREATLSVKAGLGLREESPSFQGFSGLSGLMPTFTLV